MGGYAVPNSMEFLYAVPGEVGVFASPDDERSCHLELRFRRLAKIRAGSDHTDALFDGAAATSPHAASLIGVNFILVGCLCVARVNCWSDGILDRVNVIYERLNQWRMYIIN